MGPEQWAILGSAIVAAVSAWSTIRNTRASTRGGIEQTAVDSLVDAAAVANRVPRLEALIDVLIHELFQQRQAMIQGGMTPAPLSPLIVRYLEYSEHARFVDDWPDFARDHAPEE